MQRLGKISCESRFIKNILKDSYLPSFPLVPNSGWLEKGVNYAIGDSIYLCERSGYLDSKIVSNLQCSPNVFCGVDIYTGTYGANIQPPILTFVQKYVPYKFSPNTTKNFISKTSGYDSDTHKQLGNYLRVYRMLTGVDLLPLYNYNCGLSTNLISIGFDDNHRATIKDEIQEKYTVLMVPLKLNNEYTIFANTNYKLSIYKSFMNTLGRVEYLSGSDFVKLDETIQDNSPKEIFCNFGNPYVVNTTLNWDPTYGKQRLNYLDYEECFYLLIQLPTNDNIPIYVLEGNYKNIPKSIVMSYFDINYNDKEFVKNASSFYDEIKDYPVKPSLISYPSTQSWLYSPALFEYLLKYAITSEEQIKNNVLRIQEKLNIQNNKLTYKDTWTNYTRFCV